MSHTVQNKSKLLARVRRLKGQMEAIERALEAEVSCAEILNLAASVRGATNGLVVELLVNGGAKVGHGGGAKPGQLVRVCAMARALST